MDRKKDRELYERANPVSKTAVTTLIHLAGAGHEEEKEIVKRLGVRMEDYTLNRSSDELFERCNLIIREIRHVVANRTVMESGYDTVLDVPCGYTSRVLETVRAGKTYIGGALPQVVMSFEPVIREMIPAEYSDKARFAEVDITNYSTIRDALEGTEGPVCIMTEGLMVYLNADEKKTVRSNIYRLLKERGGCWLNTDIETLAYINAVAMTVAKERAGEFLGLASAGFSKQSDTNLSSTNASLKKKELNAVNNIRGGIDYEGIKREYAKVGLKAEFIPYGRDDLTINTFEKLDDETVKAVREAFKQVNIWKFTVDPDHVPMEGSEKSQNQEAESGFSVEMETVSGDMSVTLSGRVDSLTAPAFLEAWEKERDANDISTAVIDCSKLQYISSAGLRVLLMIKKHLTDAPLVLTGVNSDVKEILTTTGFEDLFEVIPRQRGEDFNS